MSDRKRKSNSKFFSNKNRFLVRINHLILVDEYIANNHVEFTLILAL